MTSRENHVSPSIAATLLAGMCVLGGAVAHAQDWKDALGGIASRAVDAAKSKAEQAAQKPKPSGPSASDSSQAGTSGSPGTFKAYQNYDFVPGDKILFEDDFSGDTDGEFPAHWKLLRGQGVTNVLQGAPVFALTDGNYARVAPRLRTEDYLGDAFTIEFDFYPKAGGYEQLIVFLQIGSDNESDITFGREVSASGIGQLETLTGTYPGDKDNFTDRWHHGALVYKGHQIKCYLDQYRVLVVPDTGDIKPQSVQFGGIGSNDSPLLFSHVRIASGGGMNLIDKLNKDGRLVTHGILFDTGKSVVKAESMGTLRQIVTGLKSDPSLKLEIGGHTDSDGDAAKNLSLSSARAEAVKKALIDQGIEASRLTSKGYGATKPIDSNSTPEGKANNRRVEFTKL
jgi:OmpA-OmpF porin, OOP family